MDVKQLNKILESYIEDDKTTDLTHTENFKKWFGNSKVVDKNGEPLVVYHNTNANFNIFSRNYDETANGRGVYGGGFNFTAYPEYATKFGSKQMAVYLKIENPFNVAEKVPEDFVIPIYKLFYDETYKEYMKGEEKYNGYLDSKLSNPLSLLDFLQGMQAEGKTKITEFLKELGYDGIKDGHIWVAFEPTQIKSVFNNGNFDIHNPNINENIPKYIEQEVNVNATARHYEGGYTSPKVNKILDFLFEGNDLQSAIDKFKSDVYTEDKITQVYNDFKNGVYTRIEGKPEHTEIREILNPEWRPQYDGTEETTDDILDDYDSRTSTDTVGHGYSNYSMSNNAIEAYNMGSKPISKWDKKNILDKISELVKAYSIPVNVEKYSKMSVADLKKNYLKENGYHHTSKF